MILFRLADFCLPFFYAFFRPQMFVRNFLIWPSFRVTLESGRLYFSLLFHSISLLLFFIYTYFLS